MACCGFHSGMLTERVTLERRTRSADGYGGFPDTWVADPTTPVAANMKPLSGTEAIVAQRIAPNAQYRCTIRFRPDAEGNPYYQPNDRLIHRGRTFNILYVLDKDMEHKWMELLIVEGRPS